MTILTLLNGAAIVALVALSFQIWGWSTETNKPTIRLVYRSVAAVCGTTAAPDVELTGNAPEQRGASIRESASLAHYGTSRSAAAGRNDASKTSDDFGFSPLNL